MSKQSIDAWHVDLGIDELDEDSYQCAVIDSNGHTVALAMGSTPEECQARAELIASLPELVEKPGTDSEPIRQKYIVVSLKHGRNGQLCFWRPQNAGYTNDLHQAGRYTEEEIRGSLSYYHNGENVAIEESKILAEFKIRLHVDSDFERVRKYEKLAKRGLLSLADRQSR